MLIDKKPINKKSPFFFDGAFGTYYYKLNANEEACELGNINKEDTVFKIHQEYIKAGVNAIKTNTFGANSLNFPDLEIRNSIIRKGYDIACQAAAGTGVKVFADIGSVEGESLESYNTADTDEIDLYDAKQFNMAGAQNTESENKKTTDARTKNRTNYANVHTGNKLAFADVIQNEYLAIAVEFLKIGATNFLFETLSEYNNIIPAINFIKKTCPDAFIVVSFAVSQDGFTKDGHFYKNLLAETSNNSKIDVAGLNCVCGPTHIYNLLKNIDLGTKPICAMPNSGYPTNINGRTVFRDNAKYFAQILKDIYDLGVSFFGGCCGTTPEHIKAAIRLIGDDFSKKANGNLEIADDSKNSNTEKTKNEKSETPGTVDSKNIMPKSKNLTSGIDFLSKMNRTAKFSEQLANNIKVIAVEIDPPANTDIAFIMEACAKAKAANADLITVADSPLARPRADSIMLAAKIKRELSIDVLPHISCRDKNHIGIKSSLLGGVIENISNALVITGDPIPTADRADIKGVFSFNSFSLISYIKTLNEEVFPETPLLLCAALNVNSQNFKVELSRASRKQEAGAEVFFTQPIYSEESVRNLKLANESLQSKIMVGLMPVASYRNAMFLNNEVSGIDIPEKFVESLKDKTPEEVFELSLEFEMNLVRQTQAFADGYYIMTPLKRIDIVCELIKRIDGVISR